LHFDPTVSFGTLFTAISFIIAVIVFIVAMKPRIEAIEKENAETRLWRSNHEIIARERDKAIQTLAVEVAKIVAMQKNAEERIGRMDHLFETVVTKLTERRSGDFNK
jgi:hypothetical protein